MGNIARLFEDIQWNIHDCHIVHSVHCELIYTLYPQQKMRNSAFYVFDYSFIATCLEEISILREPTPFDMNYYCNTIVMLYVLTRFVETPWGWQLRRHMWEQINDMIWYDMIWYIR